MQKMLETGELRLAQWDGRPPATLVTGSAPGESGLVVLSASFQDAFHIAATPQRHLVCFQMVPRPVRFECRLADRALSHEPPSGSIAICPAGIDCAADAEGSVDAILIAIDPARLALAAADESACEARLNECFSGYDRSLLELARTLACESANGYPNGALLWNEVAGAFIEGLVARHTAQPVRRARGTLARDALDRIRDYVLAHLDEPIEVAVLAGLAARSPYHFSRVFARSVGMSPHRYVVHLRLQRAVDLVREGGISLAEIAARTGFADQSHLSRWVRRVHGVPLTQLSV